MLSSEQRKLIFELAGFVVVGLLNTAIGYGTFLVCLLLFGLNPYISNVIGYLLALSVAFILYQRVVFKSGKLTATSIVSYVVSFLVAFSINQGILYFALKYFPAYLAQLCAMAAYTVVFFLLNKFFTFRET
ncbi:MAG: polysaccharide synthesis protein GtrA [Ponticaulis sp.]|nr:polysaccharide synthesis protein GtrA [Ponticaulis sp.]|tara:strand:- start:152436 stop:152828 length:393 start_codon:yes stop_codon:yes gene_type:complete